MKTITAFETTDGKQFFDEGLAKYHQSKIDVVAKLKKTDFKISFNTEVADIEIGDLSIILELAEIIKQSEI